MRKLLALLFLIAPSVLHAQLSGALDRPLPSDGMPEWARLIYAKPVNVLRIDSAYDAFYRRHPFQKNDYTRFYKRWRHRVEPYVGSDGIVREATPDELERRFGRGKEVRLLSAEPVWRSYSPSMMTYTTTANAPTPWQVNIYGLAIHRADPNVMICATEPGAIFKSIDKGRNWSQIGAGYALGAEAVAIHPSDRNIFLVGANPSIRRSTDGGITWSTTFTASNLSIYRIEFLPSNPMIAFASTSQGVYKSGNGGVSWTSVLAGNSCELALHPSNPSIVYALRLNESTKRYELWKSQNTGDSFTARTNGWYADTSDGGGRMTTTPADPARVYTVLLTKKGPRILRSNDAGETWSIVAIGSSDSLAMTNGQGYYDLAILASPTNADHLIAATTTAYKSTNGGRSFTVLGGYSGPFGIHPDIQDMKALGNESWIATDGGLTYSTDFFTDVKNAEPRMTGIFASDFWGFDVGWNREVMVGGRYHNGNTAIADGYNGRYLRLGGGEAATGYIDPVDERIAYFSDIGGYILPDSSTGTPTKIAVERWPNESYWRMEYSRMTWDPRYGSTVWIGNGRTLWRSENGGARYDSIFAVPDLEGVAEHIEISRSDPSIMYFSERSNRIWDGRIWRSSDEGRTWDSLPRLPGTSGGERRVVQIALSGTNPNELWVALGYGSSANKVFHSTDGGSSWQNMTTATIKDLALSDMIHQLGTDGGVYLAGVGGQIFYRNNTMSDWRPYNDGVPVALFTRALRPSYRDGTLRCGSSLGIWLAPFAERSKPLAQPMVDKGSTDCPRDTFRFDDRSALEHAGATWRWEFPGASWVSSTSVRNPRVVYPAPGKYSVTLTVSNSLGSDTMTLVDMVEVRASQCDVSALAGSALDLRGTADGATIAPLPALKGATGFTVAAWIKPSGLQRSFSQILSSWSSNVGFSFGFAFKGYQANTNLTFYWRGVPYQLTSPFNLDTLVWTHVAMTVRPDTVTLYRDGVAWHYTGNFTGFDLSTLPFELGGGLPGQGGNFTGEIDELRIYGRALSVDEVRSTMHLTRPANEPGLAAYFQFNESSRDRLYDGVGALHAASVGGGHIVSTAPVAGGTSTRLNVSSGGRHDFVDADLALHYPNDSPPHNDVIAYRLRSYPDSIPTGVASVSNTYWIVRTWGSESGIPDTMIFSHIGRISGLDSADMESAFVLYKRGANEHRNNWVARSDRALQRYSPLISTVAFETSGGYGQYIIGTRGSSLLSIERQHDDAASGMTITPNPASDVVTLRLRTRRGEESLHVGVWDLLGRRMIAKEMRVDGGSDQSIDVDLSTLPAGTYVVRVNDRAEVVAKRQP